MSNIELYKPLLGTSVSIHQCQDELDGKLGWNRKSKLKNTIQNLETKLTEQCDELIKATIDSWNPKQPLSSFLNDELAALKKETDESWHRAIDDVRGRLVNLADKESKKSPARRKFEKYWWLITIAAIALVMVSLKWYWLVRVDQPFETTLGVTQRAAALEKVLDYDDSMDTRVRRGGWLKLIFLWPASPTDTEIEYAGAFLWRSISIYEYLREENAICNANLFSNENDDNIQDELAIVRIVLDDLENHPSDINVENGQQLIARGFFSRFPCE